MKKRIIASFLFGIFSIASLPSSFADEPINASAPVASSPAAILSQSNDTNLDTTESTSNNDKQATDNNYKSPKKNQDAIGNMLLQSMSLMGIAYKWGGNTPNTGMDCSGFVRYVFKTSLGIDLPRTAAEMARVGKRVSINDLKQGDLIFFNTSRGSNTHIGIYLGNNKFIQSPRTGENIQISDLSGYWTKHFNGAKRIVQETSDDDGGTSLQTYQNIRDEALPVAKRRYSKSHRRSYSTTRKKSRRNHTQVTKQKRTTKTHKTSRKKRR